MVDGGPSLEAGRCVRITAGLLQGLEGNLIRKKNLLRFVVSLNLIQRSILLDIDASSVEPVPVRKASYLG
jgi:multisubunit Na+/H+ antiporter MnhC subunit